MSKEGQDIFKIPHDVVNEQILLAAAMTSQAARELLLPRVRPDMFVDDQHSKVWHALRDAEHKGVKPTPSSLAQIGTLDKAFLDDLVGAHPTAPVNVRHHLDALMWDVARVRAVNGSISELLRALQDPASPPERVRALANQVPSAFTGGGSRKFMRDSSKLAKEHAKTLRDRMKGMAVYPFGIKELDEYGAHDLDEHGNSLEGKPLLVPGAAPGLMTVVTAISGGGKSTLVALLVLSLARQQRKILYGAWEMGAENVLELLACISCGISRGRVRAGAITDAEVNLLADRMDAIGQYVKFVELPFHKQRGVRHKPEEVLDEIHAYIADSGCEIAVFDLWRRAFGSMRPDEEEVALYRQQAIFEETQVHGMLVQQQRLKDVETRANPRPTREGIKGTSTWVDVADLIIGVYIPALMKGTPCETIETLILKQRYGRWPLAIEHLWDGDLVTLRNGRIVAYDPGSEDELGTKDTAVSYARGGRKKVAKKAPTKKASAKKAPAKKAAKKKAAKKAEP